MMSVPYSKLAADIEVFTSFFVDYIEHFDRVSQFFNGDFRSSKDWKRILKSVSNRKIERSRIANILNAQNRDFHCGVKTLANIDLLRQEDTVAVVTGQQVGLCSGPLYTLYKTITILKLAESLKRDYPEYNFVPVFWLEGEDHDYAEVSTTYILNKSNDVQKITYDIVEEASSKNLGAVGSLQLKENIDVLFDSLASSLLETEYSEKVLSFFRKAYSPKMSFNQAFTFLLNDLLLDSGLIFLNPNDKEMKKLLSPLFVKEIEQTPRNCQLVIEQSDEVERGYHAQVKPQPVNLFLFHESGRYLIEPRGELFTLKGFPKVKFTKEELLQLARETPELFSPNVVLRPLCQDTLLPTAAYIAGPSEIAYFAQLKRIYEHNNLPMPLLYPRASVTLVEERVQKICARYNFQPPDLIHDRQRVKEKVLQQIAEINLDEIFSATIGTVEASMNTLGEYLERIDPTVRASSEKTREKILQHLNVLRAKGNDAQEKLHETAIRQIEKSIASVYPNDHLQERSLNVLYYLNKYGLEFLRWLYNELRIDVAGHQFLDL
jgi:bacillithiol biosynthesis cysteine-adding enzyme BshC